MIKIKKENYEIRIIKSYIQILNIFGEHILTIRFKDRFSHKESLQGKKRPCYKLIKKLNRMIIENKLSLEKVY